MKEIDRIIEEATRRLKELKKPYMDVERNHVEADEIICDGLDYMGYDELTKAFYDVDKLYS